MQKTKTCRFCGETFLTDSKRAVCCYKFECGELYAEQVRKRHCEYSTRWYHRVKKLRNREAKLKETTPNAS